MLQTIFRLLGLRRDDSPPPPPAKKLSMMLRLQQNAARTAVNYELRPPKPN